jgi:UDP-MurNAc hydroxylase
MRKGGIDFLKKESFTTELFNPTPELIKRDPSNNNRLIVKGQSGVFQTDRWCPHKYADLMNGRVEGDHLVCPKHKWHFDLMNNGSCVTKDKSGTVNACPYNLDW